jgi:hypothetical protein
MPSAVNKTRAARTQSERPVSACEGTSNASPAAATASGSSRSAVRVNPGRSTRTGI